MKKRGMILFTIAIALNTLLVSCDSQEVAPRSSNTKLVIQTSSGSKDKDAKNLMIVNPKVLDLEVKKIN